MQELHDYQVAKIRKETKEEISIAQERTDRVQLELVSSLPNRTERVVLRVIFSNVCDDAQAKLKMDTAKMVPAFLEEAARKDVDEVWEMLEDTRKETLVALERRRERIDMSQFVGANEQNVSCINMGCYDVFLFQRSAEY